MKLELESLRWDTQILFAAAARLQKTLGSVLNLSQLGIKDPEVEDDKEDKKRTGSVRSTLSAWHIVVNLRGDLQDDTEYLGRGDEGIMIRRHCALPRLPR